MSTDITICVNGAYVAEARITRTKKEGGKRSVETLQVGPGTGIETSVNVPDDEKVTLTVENRDATPEEVATVL